MHDVNFSIPAIIKLYYHYSCYNYHSEQNCFYAAMDILHVGESWTHTATCL